MRRKIPRYHSICRDSPAALIRFNAATTFCFSQTAREANFDFGGNRIFPADNPSLKSLIPYLL